MGGVTGMQSLGYDPVAFSGSNPTPNQDVTTQVAPDPGANPSLLEQANQGIQQATQNFVPLSIPGVSDANQGPIIQGLPGDIQSYVKKYSTNLPALQQAVAAGTITPEAVSAVQSYDAQRVVKGQAPLNAKQTAGALQTVSTGQQATPEPSHSAWDVFGNAHRDLATIVSSVPHLLDPRTYINEAKQLPQIPQDIAAAPNPIEGFFQAPGIRLVPGAFTLGNLAGGRKGIETALTHPVMTALDAMAINHGVGVGLATDEETAAARAAGEHVPGAIGRAMQSTGLQEPYDSFKSQMKEAILTTKGGIWADAAVGDRSRALGLLVNRAAAQARDALNPALEGGTSLIDPTQVITQLTRPIMATVKEYAADISPQRLGELTDYMQTDPEHQTAFQPEKIPDLTDRERAFMTDIRGHIDNVTDFHVGNQELQQLSVNGQTETYTPSEANTIMKAWNARDRYQAFTMVRQAVRNPDLLTPEHLPVLADQVRGFIANDDYSGLLKQRLARGYRFAVRAIDGTVPDGYAKAVAAKDWATVDDMLANHQPTFDLPQTNREATLTRDWQTLTRKYTPSRRAEAFNIAGRVEDQVLPSRWRELQDQMVKGKVTDKLVSISKSDNINVDDMLEHANQMNYRRIADAGLLDAKDMKQFTEEARTTIGEIRRQTQTDPVFVHRFEPEQVAAVQYGANPAQGTISGTVKTPSQLRETPDTAKPYVHNISVAVTHEAQQIVNQAAQRYIYSELLRTTPAEGETVAPFARTEADLLKQYGGVAQNRANINPQITDLGVVNQAMKRGWMKFPIEKLPSDLKESLGLRDEMGENHPWIQKAVYKNLEKMDTPSYYPILDPLMKVFRTALLPLSPRFLLYHMVGGMIQLAGQTDPFTMWKYLGDARDMVARYHNEAGVADDEAVNVARQGESPRPATFPETLRPVLGHIMDPALEWEWQAGGTVRRLMGDGPIADAADAAHDKFTGLIKKSYGVTSFFQDTYRAMGYLYGYDKGLAEGLSAEQAATAGETLARKALMTWDDMTAIERTGMRAIFPFYGFARHILQYAAQYPIDHPFRAAVISSIARNEMNDLGTGLPTTMLNMLMLGHPDKHGHVDALMGGALNPFRDVANMTTLAGWLSATNPIISGVLQSAGLDTSGGGPDLYPNLQYDPDTGRLAAKSTNPLLNILTQAVPQSQLLLGMLSKSSEYHDLMRTNPSSAMRLIASQAGIPLVVEDQNVAGQQIKGEVTRETAAATAYDNALKTGDYSEAMKWPTIAPVLQQVNQLKQAGALSQFMPGGANDSAKLQQIAQMIGSIGQ